ncbi:PfkB family carbohydrate kinase [Roseobacter sp.]|uniref:PfkB family carbohydrate kinase n=1 Tax=Roseobacter sp. TaxID=1907202 RepID=UPI003297D73F
MTLQDIITSISQIEETARVDSKTVVFVQGKFNIVHPGHVRLLKFAAEQGDLLVVGISPDSDTDISVPAAMRLEALQAMNLVDEAFIMEGDVTALLRELRPNVMVKGIEYKERPNPETSVLAEFGGKLVFGSGDVKFSSLDLLRREYIETGFSSINKPRDFPARRGFGMRDLKSAVTQLAGLRVLVIGDLIVDTYINCEALGMSQEDPTIVVSPIEQSTFVGGAGIVAAHARGMGGDVSYVTICGQDDAAGFATQELDKMGVEACMFPDSTRPTTNKQRFRANGKTLLRVNHLRQLSVSSDLADKLVDAVVAKLGETDLLLFSDFNYGCLPQTVVDRICKAARKRDVMMAADSQASSQVSDISRFRGMTLVTPTEREARLALQDPESGLIVVADELRKKAQAEHLAITLGAEGVLIYGGHGTAVETDQLPAFNTIPKDVAGAGDSFFTCCTMALCAGIDIWRSSYLGSVAAGCQVSRVGNTPLSATELVMEIDYGRN